MTNDDRNPNPQHDGQQEPPRYGERTTPEQGSAPQYGDQPTQQYGQQSAPQWGQQQGDQYGQQQYGQQQQQYGQPQQQHGQAQQYGQPQHGGAPAWQAHDGSAAKRKKTVGVVAFVVGVVALVLGVVAGVLLGNGLANSDAMRDIIANGRTSAGAMDSQELQRQIMEDPDAMSSLGTGAVVFMIGTLFGVWAIVQGIVATATKRGRLWGILAIVLAVVAFVVAIAVYAGAVGNAVSGSM
jgi:hypothetical protein